MSVRARQSFVHHKAILRNSQRRTPDACRAFVSIGMLRVLCEVSAQGALLAYAVGVRSFCRDFSKKNFVYNKTQLFCETWVHWCIAVAPGLAVESLDRIDL